MTSRERQHLLDILIAAEDAISFVRGITFDELVTNALIQRAALHCLTVIGEAADRIEKATEVAAPVELELPSVVAALAPLFPERTK